MDKVTEIKVERYIEELKELGVEAKLELIKRLCASLDGPEIEVEDKEERKAKKA